MEWISVEDRLPEKMDNYLMFGKGSGIYRDFIQIGIYSSQHGGFITANGEATHIPTTHWMPLPPPPEG